MADHSQGKHTQIVQVLLPAPEPKKPAPRRRRVARRIAEATPTAEPAPYNGYTPVYPSFTAGMPTFSPSIDITTGSQYPPPPLEPPAEMATIPPIEAEAEVKPTKKKSKLKGIIKAVGRGVATALEAIGEKPTTGGITPIMPEPIPVELTAPPRVEEPTLPSFIPPYPMPSYQMYQPSPYMLTGEPMTQEAETQTAPSVIYAPPTVPTTREMGTETEKTKAQQKKQEREAFIKSLSAQEIARYKRTPIPQLKNYLYSKGYKYDELNQMTKADLYEMYLTAERGE